MSQEFLATVLPSSGYYCACEVSTANKAHVFVDTVEEAYNAALSFSHLGYESYYALASYKEKGKRTAANADKMRSLFVDIDCGPGKDYDTKQAAAAALDSFLSDTIQEALIAQKVLSIVLGQDKDTVEVEDVRALYETMLNLSGVDL